MKRLFDVGAALPTIILLLPLFLIIALAVRLDSSGPVLFRQQRIGLGGRTFVIYKFRSMVREANSIGPYWTMRCDPRITRVGLLIRRTSLDELPQLFNVLLGDMSLVGPRPDVPAQKENYSDEDWRVRHQVRPGITGLAQATLRSAATRTQRLALDLEYVERASLLLDLKILLLTVRQVIGKGSY